MRITTQGDYALRCILRIAREGGKGPVSISRIVEEEGLPLDYIQQLLMKLRRRKLIRSVRGVRGGYLLLKQPSQISVKDILEAVEGGVFEMVCLRRKKNPAAGCRARGGCCLKGLWQDLKKRIEDFLAYETLKTLIKKTAQRRRHD